MHFLLRTLTTLATSLALLLLLAAFSPKNPWTNLLDRDLSQWEKYLSYAHTEGYNGDQPLDAAGNPMAPIGYNRDETGVFTVEEIKGEPVLHVSGEFYGCIFTKQSYRNYHLRMKVRWGTKKWIPRTDKLRDSGVLYHSVGDCGVDYWRALMLSQEFQVMEGHMGDYWNIANSAIDIRAYLPEGMMNPVANEKQPLLSVGAGTGLDGFCLRKENRESPPGEWTTLELICFEGKSVHIVNGGGVMALQNSRYLENGQYVPLDHGKIQIQSEAAEVFFKDIQIRELEELPKEWAGYF